MLNFNTPLKDLGELGLALEILHRATNLGFAKEVTDAMMLADGAHRGQTRSNRGVLPRDTYITHPLRNALRLLRAGVSDKNVIIAAILHDVVEDGPDVVVHWFAVYTVMMPYDKKNAESVEYYRRLALQYISFTYGEEVARLVAGVTNPVVSNKFALSAEAKRKVYQGHVRSSIEDASIGLVKLADIVDNAAGLKHNTSMSDSVRSILARKYHPLMDDFGAFLNRDDVRAMMSEVGRKKFQAQIILAESTLWELIKEEH